MGAVLMVILYGFAAAVLPVWLLLAPRDYLSTFMKLAYGGWHVAWQLWWRYAGCGESGV
jgi:carbon starvation protein CstA